MGFESEEINSWEIKNEKVNLNDLPRFERVKTKIKRWFSQIFTRDFNIHRYDIIVILLQAFVFITLITFWVIAIDRGLPDAVDFSQAEKTILYSLAGLSVFFGGIFVDLLIKKKYVYEIISFVMIFAMLLMVYVPVQPIRLIGAILLSIGVFILGIIFFTTILSKTTLLNRARTVSIILFILVLFCAPIIIIINTYSTYNWIWILTTILVVSMFFTKSKLPRNLFIGQIKDNEVLSPKKYLKLIRDSQILSYLYFFALISSVLGFYVGLLTEKVREEDELVSVISIVIIVCVLAFPIIGGMLDNIGRKPIVVLTILAVAIFSIFFDYPVNDTGSKVFRHIQIGVLAFAALLIIVLTPVIAGDNSSLFSRGRVMGIFLFTTVGGFLLGIQIQFQMISTVNFTQKELIQISSWTTVFLFVAVIILSRAGETFDLESPHWRKYLKKLYIITEAGIGLYAADFEKKTTNKNQLNEDLVSGGLSGIQLMLKEIAQSNRNIQILDHGDIQIIFHYGQYSVSVLFVSKDLVVFREKLARFHEEFEDINKKVLPHFTGNISRLKSLDELRRQYFF